MHDTVNTGNYGVTCVTPYAWSYSVWAWIDDSRILTSRPTSLSDSWEQTHTIPSIEFVISNTHRFGSESPMSALVLVPMPDLYQWHFVNLFADRYTYMLFGR